MLRSGGGGEVTEGLQVSYLKQHPLPTYIISCLPVGNWGIESVHPVACWCCCHTGCRNKMRLSTHTPRSVSVWISQRTWPLSPVLGQADDATMRMSPRDHGPVSSVASRHTCHAKWTLLWRHGPTLFLYTYVHARKLIWPCGKALG